MIYDDAGELVSESTDIEMSRELGLGPEAYTTMKSLYEDARAKALNVTKVLDDLLDSLGTM
jgi:hypothetical protein